MEKDTFLPWKDSLFLSPEPYSKFPFAIYFTYGNVSFHVILSIHLSLLIDGAKWVEIYRKKINLDYICHKKKNELKKIIGLNAESKTTKFWDNTGQNLDNLGYGDDLLDKTSRAWSMREITDKLNFIKTKSFCSLKDIVKSMNRWATNWQKDLQNTYW